MLRLVARWMFLAEPKPVVLALSILRAMRGNIRLVRLWLLMLVSIVLRLAKSVAGVNGTGNGVALSTSPVLRMSVHCVTSWKTQTPSVVLLNWRCKFRLAA